MRLSASAASGVRLLARLERRFLAQALGVALGLAQESIGFGLRPRQRVVREPPAAARPPQADDNRHGQGGEDEENSSGKEVERGRRAGR